MYSAVFKSRPVRHQLLKVWPFSGMRRAVIVAAMYDRQSDVAAAGAFSASSRGSLRALDSYSHFDRKHDRAKPRASQAESPLARRRSSGRPAGCH